MERYVSDPFEFPPEYSGYRVDLVFYGVDHSGPSYEARVFIDNPDASVETAQTPAEGFAGSFVVFGHAGCYGDAGHCDIHDRVTDAFDLRPPHPLAPWTKTVIIDKNALGRAKDAIVVTVVCVAAGEQGAEAADLLEFEHVRLLSYAP